mgnify:CR=1 FL=1
MNQNSTNNQRSSLECSKPENKLVNVIKKKSSISAEKKASKNITIMLILISLMYSFCNLPYAFYLINEVLNLIKNMPSYYETIIMCCLITLVLFKFFIYLFFNKLYRSVFNSYFKKILWFFRACRMH